MQAEIMNCFDIFITSYCINSPVENIVLTISSSNYFKMDYDNETLKASLFKMI